MHCSRCGLAVIVVNLQTITACHCNAPVVANIQASCAGAGGLRVDPPKPK